MNQREIKFRIWNSKFMTYPHTSESNFLVVRLDGEINGTCFGELDGPEPGSVLLQYTGLKDKNGKEIYEGDIVRTIYTEPDKTTGQIVYASEIGAYRVRCGSHLLPIVTYRVENGSPQGLLNVVDEVIGNIHENMDLLK